MKKFLGYMTIVTLLFALSIIENMYLSNRERSGVEYLVHSMENLEEKCKENGDKIKVGKRTDLIRGKYSFKSYVVCE
ncbi:MAG: hypothetical protein F6K54_20145 [Okeania sp. SIO3B5]|uniref:hypothetical protein n=1 Tax=Okeania sp. SIO3B5 TaxID=2607811 RepID=UPI0013FEEC1A|nr:hypothetical protein [Okeania sp. SIO3B5]NEO55184.1 hypothetical protein [Okeania sp. SIO3B5]